MAELAMMRGMDDEVDVLDALFPTEESLDLVARVDGRLARYELELARTARDLELAAEQRRKDDAAEVDRIERATQELFTELDALRARARQVETHVASMTAGISKLDTTKRNLTATMTLVKRLQMLTTAFYQLSKLSKSRKYGETASLLSAVVQLMTHFRAYRSVPQIATLSQNVADLQRTLLENVSQDFETFFAAGLSAGSIATLGHACELVDVLGDGPRERICTWYINAQLREYRSVFRPSEEAASLDNLARRFAWLKRILKQYDDQHSRVFPAAWGLHDALICAAAQGTKEDIAEVLARAQPRPAVSAMMAALQETVQFERYLAERLSQSSPQVPQRQSIDSIRSTDSGGVSASRRKAMKMSEAFEPYLGAFVDEQDRVLQGKIAEYRTQEWPDMDEEVLPSSADLFYFYLTTLAQCAQLSTGQPMADLSRVMAKYLNLYCANVLEVKYTGGVVTVEEIIMVLRTADYCATTARQLEDKVKATINPALSERISLDPQVDSFQQTMSRSISLLVSHLDKVVNLGLADMAKTRWADLDSTRDQSPYVAAVVAGLLREGKRVLQNLHKERFVRTFCDRVVENFATAFLQSVARCRPIEGVAAEQLVLDVHAIKAALLNLAGSGGNASSGAEHSQQYAKLVNRQVAQVECFLKLLLGDKPTTSPEAAEGLIQNYLFLVADRSMQNFVKVLDVRGVPRLRQGAIVHAFNQAVHRHEAAQQAPALQDRNPWLSRIAVDDSNSGGGIGIGIGGAGGGSGVSAITNTLGATGITGAQRKLDPGAFFRDQLGIGAAPNHNNAHRPEHSRQISTSLPITRQNTGYGGESNGGVAQGQEAGRLAAITSPRTPQPEYHSAASGAGGGGARFQRGHQQSGSSLGRIDPLAAHNAGASTALASPRTPGPNSSVGFGTAGVSMGGSAMFSPQANHAPSPALFGLSPLPTPAVGSAMSPPQQPYHHHGAQHQQQTSRDNGYFGSNPAQHTHAQQQQQGQQGYQQSQQSQQGTQHSQQGQQQHGQGGARDVVSRASTELASRIGLGLFTGGSSQTVGGAATGPREPPNGHPDSRSNAGATANAGAGAGGTGGTGGGGGEKFRAFSRDAAQSFNKFFSGGGH